MAFWAKSTVQCSDQLKHKITLKFNKNWKYRLKFGRWDSEITVPLADHMFSWLPMTKIDSRASKVADESTGRQDFLAKYLTCLTLLVGRSEDRLVVHRSLSDRPNMSISIGLSLFGRWWQYKERPTILVGRLYKSVAPTKYFFQSPTSRPFYGSRLRDSSAHGTGPLVSPSAVSAWFCVTEWLFGQRSVCPVCGGWPLYRHYLKTCRSKTLPFLLYTTTWWSNKRTICLNNFVTRHPSLFS